MPPQSLADIRVRAQFPKLIRHSLKLLPIDHAIFRAKRFDRVGQEARGMHAAGHGFRNLPLFLIQLSVDQQQLNKRNGSHRLQGAILRQQLCHRFGRQTFQPLEREPDRAQAMSVHFLSCLFDVSGFASRQDAREHGRNLLDHPHDVVSRHRPSLSDFPLAIATAPSKVKSPRPRPTSEAANDNLIPCPMNNPPAHLICSFSVLISCSFLAHADFNPVPLAASSFNSDVIVERTAPGPIGRATNASMDGGTNNSGASWYEIGFNTAAPATGLPAAGSTFTSAAAASHQYQMAPSFTANNAMLIDSTVSNGTWALTAPAAYTNLPFLTSGGHKGRTVGVLVHHQDGTFERGSFISPDWFNGVSPAVTANGRVDVQSFAFDSVNSGNPRLYSRDMALTNKTSPVISIDLTNASGASGGNVGIFAVSGTTPTSSTWTPITVTGYNADRSEER